MLGTRRQAALLIAAAVTVTLLGCDWMVGPPGPPWAAWRARRTRAGRTGWASRRDRTARACRRAWRSADGESGGKPEPGGRGPPGHGAGHTVTDAETARWPSR